MCTHGVGEVSVRYWWVCRRLRGTMETVYEQRIIEKEMKV
jgi:hypothetical protein